VGDFQQRKTSQKIQDNEINGYAENQFFLGETDEEEKTPYRLNIGVNFRQKERVFKSLFVGVSARDFSVNSVNEMSNTFTLDNFNTAFGDPELILREQLPDIYNADLTIFAGYANLDFGMNKRFSGNLGFRYELDKVDVIWDVTNFVGRVGTITKEYQELYPSVNLKYEINNKSFFRLASSITQTLPEFKEIAPFEYVSPTGRVIKGNPDLERSSVFNVDTKWEFYPSREELLSTTVFYKNIQDPINLAQSRGSAGIFQYQNTGKKSTVFGIELEGRINLVENDDEKSILSANMNLTKMWFNQDILELYQYNGQKEAALQGASDFIVNSSISFRSRSEKEFLASITGNYSSDKIYALGSPEDFINSATLFNDEIIEKGFVSLDLVVSKKINKKLSVRVVGKNLLNPRIEQKQLITVFDANNNIVSLTNQTVQSYKRGSVINIGFNYKF
jgi:outer membrane receptor protein involved in Fe transport